MRKVTLSSSNAVPIAVIDELCVALSIARELIKHVFPAKLETNRDNNKPLKLFKIIVESHYEKVAEKLHAAIELQSIDSVSDACAETHIPIYHFGKLSTRWRPIHSQIAPCAALRNPAHNHRQA